MIQEFESILTKFRRKYSLWKQPDETSMEFRDRCLSAGGMNWRKANNGIVALAKVIYREPGCDDE